MIINSDIEYNYSQKVINIRFTTIQNEQNVKFKAKIEFIVGNF